MKKLGLVFLLLAALCAAQVEAKSSYSGGFSSRSSSSSKYTGSSYSGSSSKSSSSYNSFSSASSKSSSSYNSFSGSDKGSSLQPSRQSAASAVSNSSALPGGSKSALSAGLDKKASQEKALATLDRRNAKNTSSSTIEQTSATPLGGAGSVATAAPSYTPSAPTISPPNQTVVYRDSGNSFMNNLGWFMLGRSMADHHEHSYERPTSYGSGVNSTGDNPFQGNGASVAPAAKHDSMFMWLLRIALWALIIGAMVWLGWRFFAPKKSGPKSPNYSL